MLSLSDNARTRRNAADVQIAPEAGDAGGIDETSVRRFISELPALGRILAEPVTSKHELIVRSEMRRTVLSLAAALAAAAHAETCVARADAFFTASRLARAVATSETHPSHAGRAH